MTDTPPRGAPRSWDPDHDFIQVSREAIREVGPVAAIVWHHLVYRCKYEGRGYWRATLSTIAEEVGIPKRTVERAVKTLRDNDLVTSDQEKPQDVTLTWRIVWAVADGSATSAEGGPPHRRRGSADVAVSPIGEDLEDVETRSRALVEHHADLVAANGDRRPSTSKAAIAAAERLLAEHDPTEIRDVLAWALSGDFWPSRMLTMSKVAKNFGTARSQWAAARRGPAVENRFRSSDYSGDQEARWEHPEGNPNRRASA